jgi:hypothetical protein
MTRYAGTGEQQRLNLAYTCSPAARDPSQNSGPSPTKRYLDENAVIILLSNSVLNGGVQPIAFVPDVLEKILFGGEYATPSASVPMTGNELQRYQGTYRMFSGGSFVVSIKNGSLTLDSEGRDAVAVLTYPDADRSPSPLADRFKTVFDSMSHGDFAPLEEIVGPQAALDHTKRFGKFWPEWESALGHYRGAQVLITTPTGSRLSTYIQLNFEKGSQVIRAARREGGPVSFSRGGLSSKSAFLAVPISRDQFSYFDFRSGKNVVIEFPTTNDGRVSEMVLHLPKTVLRLPTGDR